MNTYINLTKTVGLNSGGITYRDALIQGDYYRISHGMLNNKHGINLQAVKNNFVVFQSFMPMAKKRAVLLSDKARHELSNVFNPYMDYDK